MMALLILRAVPGETEDWAEAEQAPSGAHAASARAETLVFKNSRRSMSCCPFKNPGLAGSKILNLTPSRSLALLTERFIARKIEERRIFLSSNLSASNVTRKGFEIPHFKQKTFPSPTPSLHSAYACPSAIPMASRAEMHHSS
jgi:hypothetical protein